MNAQPGLFEAAGASSASDGLPMPRATLEGLERSRDLALARLLDGFDSLAAGMDAARDAAVSFTGEPDAFGNRRDPASLSEDALKALHGGNGKRDARGYDRNGERDARTWREVFADETRQKIDRAVWGYIIEATDLEKLMDRQARDEFRESLAKDPPAPTVENVRATLGHYMAEAPLILQRGIAKAFSGLDRRFKSHDGFKIGGRVILDRLFSVDGFRHRGGVDETLRDIERAFLVLDETKGEQVESYAGVVGLLDGIGYSTPRPVVVESDWVRIRVFKNGNAHLWFKRDDLVRKVNRLLADYYGETIGEGSEVADVSEMGPGYHLTPARNLGFFETSEDLAARVLEPLGLEYQARTRQKEGKPALRILEPSAGNGALADPMRKAGAFVHCVEVDTGRAAVLRSKGHSVKQADFLTLERHHLGDLVDGVVMNPPFDMGRDCDHVRHALQFVKPGGFLVAIMSARAEFSEQKRCASLRALLEKECRPAESWRGYWEDLPAGSFAHAGTMVNTVVLRVRKKD